MVFLGLQGVPKNAPPFPPTVLPDAQGMPKIPWTVPPAPLSILTYSPKEIETVSGRIVRFNSLLMPVTSQGDLIFRTGKDRSFVRLVYCPMDCGFDAPLAEASKVPPRQMITDGTLAWTFRVHPPRSVWEKGACASIDRAAIQDKNGKIVVIDDERLYAPVPAQEAMKTPPLASLPCMVIVDWLKAADAFPPARLRGQGRNENCYHGAAEKPHGTYARNTCRCRDHSKTL